jgi:hypothetical protein
LFISKFKKSRSHGLVPKLPPQLVHLCNAMPRTIATNHIVGLDTEKVVLDDNHPGALGFDIQLSQHADAEWIAEFDDAYRRLHHPVLPPVTIESDRMTIHFLPAYTPELSAYLAHLEDVVAEANRQVEARNSARPDDTAATRQFLNALQTAARHFPKRTH